MKFRLVAWILLGWSATVAPPSAMAQHALDMRWHPGAEECAPQLQRTEAHAIDEHTIVIRQNPCVDSEANLLYLLIGAERALLIDSGASEDPRLTAELTGLVGSYLGKPDGSRLPLVVAHTHGHRDHRAGDAAFAALPLTTVVPQGEGMRRYFGFDTWPDDEVRFDLGGRELVLRPTPGHHPDHLVFYDSRTGLLFTGDYYLPGRLLVDDIGAYRQSARHMVEFAATWGTRQALGAHIELDANGELYPSGATFHPDERALALPYDIDGANELLRALMDFNGFYSRYPDFVVVNPLRNLIALAAGLIAVLMLLGWGARRWWKRRRLSGTTWRAPTPGS